VAAVNRTGVKAANGQYYDYIELHNPTDKPVSLNGYRLSKKEDPAAYKTLPNVQLAPGEYKLVFCGDTDSYNTRTKEIFIAMGLGRYGEHLYLLAPDGRVVGEHIGLAYYTLGQRRGLGIGGGGDGRRWFVVDKDLEHNVLVVEQGEDSPRLYSRFVRASGATWIAGDPPAPDGTPMRLTARFRYRQSDQAVTVVARGESLLIAADELQRAVTPGQSVVLYDGDVCLGGAVADAAGMTAKG